MNEKVVKLFELDGRGNYLNVQVAEKVAEIESIASSIDSESGEKAKWLKARDSADAGVIISGQKVKSVEDTLEEVKKRLKEAKSEESAAVKNRENFDDAVSTDFDARIENLSRDKKTAEKEKAAIIAEAERIQSEIETLQAELEKQGIKINIDQSKAPRTSTI